MTGDELRAARAALGLTQRALAARFGCHRHTILRWESGHTAIPAHEERALVTLLEAIRAAQEAWRAEVRQRLRALGGLPRPS